MIIVILSIECAFGGILDAHWMGFLSVNQSDMVMLIEYTVSNIISDMGTDWFLKSWW